MPTSCKRTRARRARRPLAAGRRSGIGGCAAPGNRQPHDGAQVSHRYLCYADGRSRPVFGPSFSDDDMYLLRPLCFATLLATACSAPVSAPVTVVPPPRADVPISDPFEYGIDRISREAVRHLRAHRRRRSVSTGLPYPIFLALMRAYPQTFGGSPRELAQKFGFIAQGDEPPGRHAPNDRFDHRRAVRRHQLHAVHAEKVGDQIASGSATSASACTRTTRRRAHRAEALDREAAPARDEAAAERKITWPDRFRDLMVGATVDALRKGAPTSAPS